MKEKTDYGFNLIDKYGNRRAFDNNEQPLLGGHSFCSFEKTDYGFNLITSSGDKKATDIYGNILFNKQLFIDIEETNYGFNLILNENKEKVAFSRDMETILFGGNRFVNLRIITPENIQTCNNNIEEVNYKLDEDTFSYFYELNCMNNHNNNFNIYFANDMETVLFLSDEKINEKHYFHLKYNIELDLFLVGESGENYYAFDKNKQTILFPYSISFIKEIIPIYNSYIVKTYFSDAKYFLYDKSMKNLIIKAYDFKIEDRNTYFYDEDGKIIHILNN